MTIACFHVIGNRPVESDVLNRIVMYGPIVVAQLFSNHAGSGSELHCFIEDEPMALRTSSTVTDSRSDNVDIVLFEYNGLSPDSVAAWISAVFLSMTSRYCSVVTLVSALGLCSPSNVFTCHKVKNGIPPVCYNLKMI